MKLHYWYSQCPFDSDCYSVREKTKKEAKLAIEMSADPESWPEPVKVTIDYRDGFDLMKLCIGEGGIWQEDQF